MSRRKDELREDIQCYDELAGMSWDFCENEWKRDEWQRRWVAATTFCYRNIPTSRVTFSQALGRKAVLFVYDVHLVSFMKKQTKTDFYLLSFANRKSRLRNTI